MLKRSGKRCARYYRIDYLIEERIAAINVLIGEKPENAQNVARRGEQLAACFSGPDGGGLGAGKANAAGMSETGTGLTMFTRLRQMTFDGLRSRCNNSWR